MDNNRTIVRIAGMEFKLTGDESQQYMDSLAEMVNAKVDEVKRTYPMLSTGNCVLLAALNMAEELTKLRSDYEALDQRISDLREMPKRNGASVSGPIPLPTKKEVVPILRAVHKYKDSREQFERRTHKRLIDILNPNQKTVEALMSLDLPAGVEIEIKL